MRVIQAPGKVFWIGEYAVLEGARALVAAVDAHVEVHTRPRSDQQVSFSAPTSGVPALVLWDRDGRMLPDPPSPNAALVAAVVRTLSAAGRAPQRALDVSADSSALNAVAPDGGAKLGLGSSGAVAAGLVSALAPDAPAEVVATMALQAHRQFQGGSGSGGDVLASLHGGLVAFSPGTAPTPVVPPRSLRWAILATRRPANTRALTRRFTEWRRTGAGDTLIAQMGAVATDGIGALSRGDTSAWLSAVRRYLALERELGATAGIPIVDDAVEACIRAGEAAGWVAKPSGAGGGDIVVAFGDDDADVARLEQVAALAGFDRIPLALEAVGVLQSHLPAG